MRCGGVEAGSYTHASKLSVNIKFGAISRYIKRNHNLQYTIYLHSSSNSRIYHFAPFVTPMMDLGEKLQAAEVAIGAIGLLITSIGTYIAWHTVNGMPTCDVCPISFRMLNIDKFNPGNGISICMSFLCTTNESNRQRQIIDERRFRSQKSDVSSPSPNISLSLQGYWLDSPSCSSEASLRSETHIVLN